MLKPRALRPGDRVAVVSPASPFARDEFERGLAGIRALGFEPVWDESVFARERFTSGSPATRAAAFLKAWFDPEVRALVAMRGGYGSVELLPLLTPDDLRRTPKAFIGYSDVTSLLSWLTCRCGIVGFHGPMVERRLSRGPDGYDERSLRQCLMHAEPAGDLAPGGVTALHGGEAEGPVFGGTMSLLVASLGTPFAFDPPDGCVLFLEDVNERPYRLHRMLTQLRLSGILGRARALVFGEMRKCDELAGDVRARDAIADAVADFAGPVLVGFPSGHTSGPCWTVPLGVRTRVIGTARPRLVIEEAAVD